MILLLLIILFIIFLLYRFRQRTVEEYIIDSVDLSWRNKTGVEDVVNKWILVVKDKNNNEIHRTENNDSNNRKNDTDVKLNVFSNKTFGDNIIGNNTIDIYYNDGSGDKKINTQILRFEKDEFSEKLDSFEFRDLDMSAWENAQNADCEGIYSKVKKNKSTPGVEKFGCGPQNDPNKHHCQFWKHTHTQKQLGTGKACSRGDGHVIKVQWPKKTNTDRVGLQFVDDPNPNTDSKVADSPQHYKSLFDQQQAIVDAQEKENARIAKEEADKAAAEALGGLIPNQTKLGEDGWCGHGGVVIHQVDGDVNTAKGCKRICSDTNQVWTRDTSYGLWDSDEANRIVEECTDAKLDSIWEKDGDGKRKLRSGFKASKDYVPSQNQSQPAFSYEFIMNKKNQSLGIHIGWIKLDGVLATKEQTTIHKPPNRNNNSNNMFNNNNNYSSWNANGHNVGDKIFTIVSDKQIDEIDISYWRPKYGPGWIIKENGVTKIIETSNRGNNSNPNPVVYTYNIKIDTTGGFKYYIYGRSFMMTQFYMQGWKLKTKQVCKSTGSYLGNVSNFNNKEPTYEGTGITDFSSKHKATGGNLPNNGNWCDYAVRWQGYFVPKKTGTHKFWTESDDMSYLYVNNKKVVDNGGLHGMVKKDGTFNMTKGREYLIEIFFSEKGGGDEMKVWFQGPDMSSAKHDFSGYMLKDTKICSSEMFGGRSNNGITDYKHCLECAHKWEPGTHKRSINCENIWVGDD